MTLALATALLIWPLGQAWSDGKESGLFMSEAFVRVTGNVALGKKLIGYGYADGICVLGGWVDENRSLTFRRQLQAGTSYMICGAGDADAQTVDLEILDAAGLICRGAPQPGPDPSVEFTPADTAGNYTATADAGRAAEAAPCIASPLSPRAAGTCRC